MKKVILGLVVFSITLTFTGCGGATPTVVKTKKEVEAYKNYGVDQCTESINKSALLAELDKLIVDTENEKRCKDSLRRVNGNYKYKYFPKKYFVNKLNGKDIEHRTIKVKDACKSINLYAKFIKYKVIKEHNTKILYQFMRMSVSGVALSKERFNLRGLSYLNKVFLLANGAHGPESKYMTLLQSGKYTKDKLLNNILKHDWRHEKEYWRGYILNKEFDKANLELERFNGQHLIDLSRETCSIYIRNYKRENEKWEANIKKKIQERRAKWNSVKNNKRKRDEYMRAQMRDNYKMIKGDYKDLETY